MFRSTFILCLVWSCRGQYEAGSDVRADMTFNADNDRFDVGNIVEAQKSMFNEAPSPMEEDWRRSYRPLNEVLKQDRRRHQAQKTQKISRSIIDNDFAYHDIMLDENDYVNGQYDKHLERLRISKPKPKRRSHFLFNRVPTFQTEAPKSVIQGLQEVVKNYLHGGKILRSQRRKANARVNAESEVLLHYAVPLNMTVKGFLEVPKNSLV